MRLDSRLVKPEQIPAADPVPVTLTPHNHVEESTSGSANMIVHPESAQSKESERAKLLSTFSTHTKISQKAGNGYAQSNVIIITSV